MIKVLHLAAHAGGGVGKALSGLAEESKALSPEIAHSFVFFEPQEKPQFFERIVGCGCEVFVSPQPSELKLLVDEADIVQLEFWNHPLTLQALCTQCLPAMRLLVWCHISGLYNPVIPTPLFSAAERFLFTSPCSCESERVSKLSPEVRDRLAVVSSCGGFKNLPFPAKSGGELALGYIGSLNFAKLHPRYVEFLASVSKPDLTVKLIGDLTNKAILERQAAIAGRKGMLNFRGYCTDIAGELKAINVLAYLLNPHHYGTTENALLEAMAMGVVPIVLDNPAERQIIEDRRTGLIVTSPAEFAEAVNWLADNPVERLKMGLRAAEAVRGRYAVSNMVDSINKHYKSMLAQQKKHIDFKYIFGVDPADWFLSCQGHPEFYAEHEDGASLKGNYAVYGLTERTKGSVYHFLSAYPCNQRLKNMVEELGKVI
jgi:glycosyltransferase involved in cell wall biosynthesis